MFSVEDTIDKWCVSCRRFQSISSSRGKCIYCNSFTLKCWIGNKGEKWLNPSIPKAEYTIYLESIYEDPV